MDGMPDCIQAPCTSCGSQIRRRSGCNQIKVVLLVRKSEPMLMMMMIFQAFHVRGKAAELQSCIGDGSTLTTAFMSGPKSPGLARSMMPS